MKIGLYGGTFDPIHHGHLILARTALEELGLDRVVFIPAAISPHKLGTTPTSAAIRWEMVQASILDEPAFYADELELHRSGPSYTVDTVETFRQRHPEAELFYFIGTDHLPALPSWHRIAELEKNVQFVVLDRDGTGLPHPFPKISRRVDVSASDIRNRVAKGLSIRYLVTTAVGDLIHRHHLYQIPPH